MLRRAALAAVACGALLGCVQTVKEQAQPALASAGTISHIAVAPFTAAGALAATPADSLKDPTQATQLVSSWFAEALAARGVQVVAPSDVARVVTLEDATDGPARGRMAAAVQREFGADALLIGQVRRYQDRVGSAAGATEPAWIAFDVRLVGAPLGQLLWSASVDERQKPLGSNVFDASRYPGGGLRFLSVEELGRWAAGKAAAQVPLNP